VSATSAALTSIAGGALAITDILSLIPKGNIGGITVQATIEEVMTDTLEVTENPVEAGAAVTDHSFIKPAQLVMRCGWSNSSQGAFITAVSGVLQSLFSGGQPSPSDFVSGIYSQLLALQQSRQLFTVSTTIRQYTSMLMPSLVLTRDEKTSQALMVTLTMKQFIIVNTQTTTLPPTANQANPASTAETTNAGPLATIAGQTPAPGGALPPTSWSPTTAAGPLASITQ
jgi:Dit-like tail protein